jgi:hypothetical protein
MGIITDGRSGIIAGIPTPPPPEDPEVAVLRDYRGHIGVANNIDKEQDLTWSGPDHTEGGKIQGPYDIENGFQFIEGADHLKSPTIDPGIDVNNTDDWVSVSMWLLLDELPSVGVNTNLSLFRLEDNLGSNYIEMGLRVQTDAQVFIRAGSHVGGFALSGTATSTSGWVFVEVGWRINDATDFIYIDPGDNVRTSYTPTAAIPATVFNEIQVGLGAGYGVNDEKGWKMANLQISRVDFGAPSTAKTVYTTPGADTYNIPAGISTIRAKTWGPGGGGGGGGSASFGGNGAGAGYVDATHTVTPGGTLDIYVGSGGGGGLGGSLSGDGGGGGGFSRVKEGGTTLQIAAGGGAGGGGDNSSAVNGGNGGAGGGATGQDGFVSAAALAGAGGDQVSGGAGGVGGTTGAPGGPETGGFGARGETGLGGGAGGGEPDGGDGGGQSTVTVGFAGGGGGAAGFYGGGGGGSSVSNNAGGAGGGGGSNYVDGGATSVVNSQGSGRFPPATGDVDYQAPAGEGGVFGQIQVGGAPGEDGMVVISYTGVVSWREKVRMLTTQKEFEAYMTELQPVRGYHTKDYSKGFGDGHIHDSSGFYNQAFTASVGLGRQGAPPPLAVNGYSYEFTQGCTATCEIQYALISDWDHTACFYFQQPTTVNNDGSWFYRLENDSGEYAQLERNGNDLILRVSYLTDPDYVDTTNLSPLFDGDFHAVVFTTGVDAADIRVDIDGVQYFSAPAGESGNPMTRIKFGNIDANFAHMAWANYRHFDAFTTYPALTTEPELRTYVEDNSDTPVEGVLGNYYGGYYRMQSIVNGAPA